MDNTNFKVYPYRWVILITIIPILAVTNMFWLTFAPITCIAEQFYHVSSLSIAFLSMCYMIIYIIMVLPASWIIDTYGFKIAVGFGAVVTAVFGLIRGIFASNFTLVVIAQLGVAIGQPFLTNSITKVAARWFPIDERASAAGIATMATYIGMIVALILTPILTGSYGIESMLMIYGIVAVISALIFIIFSKEKPLSPPSAIEPPEYPFNLKGIPKLIKQKSFLYLMFCVFIVMGIFNAVMTWIENILSPRGINPTQAGFAGGLLVIVGLGGAIFLPYLSDRFHTRRLLLIWAIACTIPGFLGLTFLVNYGLILVSVSVMGFFILGVGPIAFQYGAEIAYPIPEGTSFGMLMLMGQISGIIFVYSMDLFRVNKSGSMTISLLILITLMLVALFLTIRLKESDMISNS